MKKRIIVGVASIAVLFLGFSGSTNLSESPNLNTTQSVNSSTSTKKTVEKVKPVCDGTLVTANCAMDGINYATYIFHPAVAEKSHTETVTTYQEKVTGYCTLCNDGTYSPSCATGRGACSHHGGVAQWNAPRYSRVPEYSTKTVIDAPAKEAFFEKVIE